MTEDVPMEGVETKEEIVPFQTISILQLIKDAQSQHGLRHGDYNRYRVYCTDKLKRVRRTTKFANKHKCVKRHKAKFVKKWINDEAFTDEKLLLMQLFEAERRWANAMHDKTFLEDNPLSRRRQSMRMNLKRAVHHARTLDSLVKNSPRCDAPTKLEAQAYSLYLLGVLSFELKQWSDASQTLKAAKTVYEKLAEATHNTTLTNLYKARCREIQPQLRLCEFNTEEVGAAVASMGELMAIRMQIGGDENIDKLITEMRSKSASDDVVEILWAGDKATVLDDKARAVILGWRQAEKELAECKDPKEKMALYEKQLADTRDALDKLSDMIRRKSAENAETETLSLVKTYLDFLRLSRTAERYLAIIENTKLEKKYRPQDLLRLYDSVIEIFKEVKELNGAVLDKELIGAYNARIEYYKAFRCHYMAAAYASLGKFAEACALFERASKRIEQSGKLLKEVGKKNQYVKESQSELDALASQNETSRVTAKAQRMSQACGVDETKRAEKIDNRPLIETLDEWRHIDNLKDVNVVRNPPAFIPMPNKPMFFDLALNQVKMPQDFLNKRFAKLEEDRKASQPKPKAGGASGGKGGKGQAKTNKNQKQEAAEPMEQDGQPGGIGGMVKGWFWGKN